MSNGTRVAPKPFTVTIPANHPALFSLGGQAFHEAAGDLVDRVRKAAAVALIEDPATRVLMERYHEALSTTWGPPPLKYAVNPGLSCRLRAERSAPQSRLNRSTWKLQTVSQSGHGVVSHSEIRPI